VHEDAYDKFIDKSKLFASKLVIGDPFDKKTKLGALISEQQFKRVLEYIQIGKDEGATLVEGWFICLFSSVSQFVSCFPI
jgi:acyl-CoA reductase-like NAD-dependent aldehyde dehydrogenase